jgi:hypothetical protein
VVESDLVTLVVDVDDVSGGDVHDVLVVVVERSPGCIGWNTPGSAQRNFKFANDCKLNVSKHVPLACLRHCSGSQQLEAVPTTHVDPYTLEHAIAGRTKLAKQNAAASKILEWFSIHTSTPITPGLYHDPLQTQKLLNTENWRLQNQR